MNRDFFLPMEPARKVETLDVLKSAFDVEHPPYFSVERLLDWLEDPKERSR